jgi:hypothetical protein
MRAGLVKFAGTVPPVDITLSDLSATFGSYDVLVYAAGFNQAAGGNQGAISVGAITKYYSVPNPYTNVLIESTDTNIGNGADEGTYVRFNGLTGDSVTITLSVVNGGVGIGGVQIVGVPSVANTYYVDDTGGDDFNSGLSPTNAWQTLDKVSATGFSPGDQILFKAGGSWVGELNLTGSGTATNPIVVDMYGTGSKPFIDGNGFEAAVRLQNVSYWEVNNLELINDGGPTQSGPTDYRVGVLVKSTLSSIRNHIYLRNLTIHDVFPETGPYGHGIHVWAAGSATTDTYYDDVRVEDCYIYRTGRFGAWFQHRGSAQSNPGFERNKNIFIRNNLFRNTGGSGAETGWCDGVLLENNVVDSSGASVDPRQWARGSGYWPFKCLNVLVQSNAFMHARGEGDSCGVHIDYGCTNATVQYNLSFDNEGGFVEILGDCKDVTYRYNVSINDGSRVKGVNGAFQEGQLIWVSDFAGSSAPRKGSTNSQVYNNTMYVRPGITNFITILERSVDTSIHNNIFVIDGETVFNDSGTNTVFDNNLWYGNLPAGLPFGPSAVFADPLLANAGGTNDFDYLLSPVSPAIAAGKLIPDNGGQDYWGNPLPGGAPCIGFHERASSTGGIISVNFTAFANTNQQILPGASYGIPTQNSVAEGWLNLNLTLNAVGLPFSDGLPSTVTLSGTAPNGWATGNAAYTATPLIAGIDDYTGTATPTSVTLNNLSASFAGGYKIIAYVSGFNANAGASIFDGSSIFYYQTLSDPVNDFTGTLVQTLTAVDPGSSNAPAAQYAVFGEPALLTNDTVTLTLKGLYGGGSFLGGIQILTPGQFTAQGVPYGWYEDYGIPVDDLADDDLDNKLAWEEFVSGTDPTSGESVLKVTEVAQVGDNLEVSWLGGATGYQGNWSMCVSSNLTDWTVLESMTIPRDPSGLNTWVHTNGVLASDTLFYRPCVEYTP